MNKQNFLSELSIRLKNVPKNELEKTLQYYDEIISDRIEDGMVEEEAIKALGNIDSIVNGIMYDMPFPALIQTRVSESKSKFQHKGMWITFALIGFPLWFSVLIAFASVVFAVYISIWAVILSMYAVLLSFVVACVTVVIGGIVLFFVKPLPIGICSIGVGIICGAFAMFITKPIVLITKMLIHLTAWVARKIKSLFITKKEA